VLAWVRHSVDWPVGYQPASRYNRQKVLNGN